MFRQEPGRADQDGAALGDCAIEMLFQGGWSREVYQNVGAVIDDLHIVAIPGGFPDRAVHPPRVAKRGNPDQSIDPQKTQKPRMSAPKSQWIQWAPIQSECGLGRRMRVGMILLQCMAAKHDASLAV
jgi:hypothetical protein